MRRTIATSLGTMTILLIAGLVLVHDRPANVRWLARETLEPIGNTRLAAPVPFHGARWSVHAEVDPGRGGWKRRLHLAPHPAEFRALVGLHPDYYEEGRSGAVRVRLHARSGGIDTVVASTTLLPNAAFRQRPFVPLCASLVRWAGAEATLVAMVDHPGPRPVEVLWIEPRVVRLGREPR